MIRYHKAQWDTSIVGSPHSMKSRPRGRRRSSCSPSRSSIEVEGYRVVLVNLALNGKPISIGVWGLASKENLGLVDYAPVGILRQEISLAKGWPD